MKYGIAQKGSDWFVHDVTASCQYDKRNETDGRMFDSLEQAVLVLRKESNLTEPRFWRALNICSCAGHREFTKTLLKDRLEGIKS